MTSLAGKTLFITGASRGIGLAIAERAARDGANVAIAAKSSVPNPRLPGTIHSAAEAVNAAVLTDLENGAASVVLASVEDQPDQVAGDLQLANEFGKLTGNPVPPAPMVKEYRGLFQAEIERRQATAWLNSAPTLAEFVRNPENAALVRDEIGRAHV